MSCAREGGISKSTLYTLLSGIDIMAYMLILVNRMACC